MRFSRLSSVCLLLLIVQLSHNQDLPPGAIDKEKCGGCAENGYCSDAGGAPECKCLSNFNGANSDPKKKCIDTNECLPVQGVTYPCDTNAECQNAVGSFKCTCTAGFTGTGAAGGGGCTAAPAGDNGSPDASGGGGGGGGGSGNSSGNGNGSGSGSAAKEHPLCNFWASEGECRSNRQYMRLNCKKACNVPDKKDAAGGNCTDSLELCVFWAKRDQCFENAVWMAQNCKKSCGACNNDGCIPCPPGGAPQPIFLERPVRAVQYAKRMRRQCGCGSGGSKYNNGGGGGGGGCQQACGGGAPQAGFNSPPAPCNTCGSFFAGPKIGKLRPEPRPILKAPICCVDINSKGFNDTDGDNGIGGNSPEIKLSIKNLGQGPGGATPGAGGAGGTTPASAPGITPPPK